MSWFSDTVFAASSFCENSFSPMTLCRASSACLISLMYLPRGSPLEVGCASVPSPGIPWWTTFLALHHRPERILARQAMRPWSSPLLVLGGLQQELVLSATQHTESCATARCAQASCQQHPACSLSFIISRSINVLLSYRWSLERGHSTAKPSFGVQLALACGPCTSL